MSRRDFDELRSTLSEDLGGSWPRAFVYLALIGALALRTFARRDL